MTISKDNNTLQYTELLAHKARLDKFFTKFLDTVGDQMDSHNTDTPVWKLYKAKLKEYDDVCTNIKAKEYWYNKNLESLKPEHLSSIENAKATANDAAAAKAELEKVIKEGNHVPEPERIAKELEEKLRLEQEFNYFGRPLTDEEREEKDSWDMSKPHDVWNPTKDALDGPLAELNK